MSIFVDAATRLLVQGITGREGSFHARQMLEYGTALVAGVTPGKGGQTFESAVPIFNTMYDAVSQTGADVSVIYVPPMYAAEIPAFSASLAPSVSPFWRRSCRICKAVSPARRLET